MPEVAGQVKKAMSDQSTLIGEGEHCSFDPRQLKSMGLVPGLQVRVRKSSTDVALYTISETRPEDEPDVVRMALAGRLRLQTEDEFAVTISTPAPRPKLSDEEAEASSEFVERLNDNGRQKDLVVLAPHGGAIEEHTDSQAERVAAALRGKGVSVWRCKGWRTGGGASRQWHITSTEIHEASFPLLKTIVRRQFKYAVAFHGFSEADVLIGGAAPMKLKREIEAALKKALARPRIPVRIADPAENYDGDSRQNIVNRLTAGGGNGVQIEQSIEARTGYWQAIADAVAAVYRKRLTRSR